MAIPRHSAVISYLQQAKSVLTSSFSYTLPPSRIATAPLPTRTSSKLLVVPPAPGALTTQKFSHLPSLLPRNALVILNATKVLPARIPLYKPTGASANLLLLHPSPSTIPASTALSAPPAEHIWHALLSGRRIRPGDTLHTNESLSVQVESRNRQSATVRIHAPFPTLREALAQHGCPPLPPYIRRAPTQADAHAYQTVFASDAAEGSVAAPTAALHISDTWLNEARARGIRLENVVLHVGQGTFQPVEAECAGGHDMHSEFVHVNGRVVQALLDHLRQRSPIVAVGTTSVRTLESLFWFGVRLQLGETASQLSVSQWEPYERLESLSDSLPSAEDAMSAVLQWCGGPEGQVYGATHLLIVPGYRFHMVDALITNFHQPRSTLLMLVSAFHGGKPEDLLRVYNYALENDYRFLSYGDSSIYANDQFFAQN